MYTQLRQPRVPTYDTGSTRLSQPGISAQTVASPSHDISANTTDEPKPPPMSPNAGRNSAMASMLSGKKSIESLQLTNEVTYQGGEKPIQNKPGHFGNGKPYDTLLYVDTRTGKNFVLTGRTGLNSNFEVWNHVTHQAVSDITFISKNKYINHLFADGSSGIFTEIGMAHGIDGGSRYSSIYNHYRNRGIDELDAAIGAELERNDGEDNSWTEAAYDVLEALKNERAAPPPRRENPFARRDIPHSSGRGVSLLTQAFNSPPTPARNSLPRASYLSASPPSQTRPHVYTTPHYMTRRPVTISDRSNIFEVQYAGNIYALQQRMRSDLNAGRMFPQSDEHRAMILALQRLGAQGR